MKKYTSLLLLIAFLLGACTDVFNPPVDFGKKNSTGMVYVQLGSGNFRTILPSQYDLSVLYYKLVFTDIETDTNTVEILDRNTSIEIEMPEGTYNLTVYGYADKATADSDTENTGLGSFFTGTANENPFLVSKSGNTNLSIAMQYNPDAGILKQTAGRNGTLSYEIIIPQGASGTLTVEGSNPVNLNETENKGSIHLPSGDYGVIILLNYNDKVKVLREIVQIYDHTTSVANLKFEPEDFINSSIVTINDVTIDGKIGNIIVDDSTITVMVHPDMKDSLTALTPKISFSGTMIQPIGPQDFSAEKEVEYTVYSESGESAVFIIVVKIDTVDFTTPPVLNVEGASLSANYIITRPVPVEETLTLYYTKGYFENVEGIKNNVDVEVVAINDDTELSGIALNLENEEIYSFVVEAEKLHYHTAYSAIKQITPSTRTQLTPEDFDWNGHTVLFNSTPQPVVINATSTNGASDEITSSDITILYTGIAPTVYSSTDAPTDAGNYSISVSVAGTATFAPATNLSLSGYYVILPIVPTVIWPTDLTAIYGQTLADINLTGFINVGGTVPGIFEWDDPSTSVGTVTGSPRSFAMTFYPDSTFYTDVKNDIEVTINQAVPVASDFTFSLGTYTYDGSDKPVPEDGILPNTDRTDGAIINIRYGGGETLPRAAGNYAVTFDVAASSDGNWAAASGLSAGNLAIGRATLTAEDFIVTNNVLVYNGSSRTATVTFTNARFNDDPDANAGLNINNIYYGATGTSQNQTNVGTYPIRVRVTTASTNFNNINTSPYMTINGQLTINSAPFTTPPGLAWVSVVPGQPQQLRFAQVTAAAGPGSGTITYRVYYIAEDTDDAAFIISEGVNHGTTTTGANDANRTISNLTTGVTYSFVIEATRGNLIPAQSVVWKAIPGSNTWAINTTLPAVNEVAGQPNQLQFAQVTATVPAASSYFVYYIAEDTDDAGRIISNGIEITTATNANAAARTLTLAYNTDYSFVAVARLDEFPDSVSEIVKIKTASAVWVKGLNDLVISQHPTSAVILNYSFSATNPIAETYTLYYTAQDTDDVNIIKQGTVLQVDTASAASPGEITGLIANTLYSIVVIAEREGFDDNVSDVIKVRTILTEVGIEESGFDTIVSWDFVDDLGQPLSPASPITLTYNYSGLAVVDGKLTNTIIPAEPGTVTIPPLPNTAREYTINHGGLIAVTDIVISLYDGQVKSLARNSMPIELRLYNIVNEHATSGKYGALEMFSYAKASPSTLLGAAGNVPARGHQIINFDSQGNGIERYNSEFSRGELTGLSATGNAAATNIREVFTNGTEAWARSANGTDQITSSPSGDNTPLTPTANFTATTVASGHTTAWNNLRTQLLQNPFALLPYNVNAAFTGFSEWKYPTPVSNNSNSNMQGGRVEAPNNGRLTAANGLFEFSIVMNPGLTGNLRNIEWAGNQTVTSYANSSITFVIDENFRFVKYHAFDRYSVSGILTATSNTTAAMYFVYHEDKVVLQGHYTYRPHQTRLAHVNLVSTGVKPDTVIAPYGNTADGDMVINNSRYELNFGWVPQP